MTTPANSFKIARQITIGDIVVCVTFLFTGFAVYRDLDVRVVKIELANANAATTATTEAGRTKESMLDLKLDIKELQGTVNSMQRDVSRMTNNSYAQKR